MKVLLAHPGTQHAPRLAKELSERGLLSTFHTGIALPGRGMISRIAIHAPRPLRAKVASRIAHGVRASEIVCHPALELRALWRSRRGSDDPEAIFHDRNEAFQKAIPRAQLARAHVVIGFDTSSWLLAQTCRDGGVPFVLDQTTTHSASKQRIYEKITRDFPEWSDSDRQSHRWLQQTEKEEHTLATRISVASSFAARSLIENGVAADKIWLNPYGVDARKFKPRAPSRRGPQRFLFVGAITARKGIPLLLAAWKRLQPPSAELWLAGAVTTNDRRLVGDAAGVRMLGALPHDRIAELMCECDVFVFPSLFEGFGLVILEAMACGLPVITTPATAGPDLFRDGEAGWIVPAGDVEALANAMDHCLTMPREAEAMGRASRAIAENHTWEKYGQRWQQNLATLAT